MEGEKSWHLFDFDDMVKGFDRKKSKKRLPKVRKDKGIRSGRRANVSNGNNVIGSSSTPSLIAQEGITTKSSQVNKTIDLAFIPCTTNVAELCSPFSEIRNQSYVQCSNQSLNRSPLSNITNVVSTPKSASAEIKTTGVTNYVNASGGTSAVETSKKRDLFKRKAKPTFIGSSSTPSPTASDGITRKVSGEKKKKNFTFMSCTTNVAELSSPFSEIPNQSFVRSSNQSSNQSPLSNFTNSVSTPNSGSSDIVSTGVTNNGEAGGRTYRVETSKKRDLFKRKAKPAFIGLGKKLFTEGLFDVEDQSNDFNEGPNVIGNTLSSDESEDLDYDCSEISTDEDEDSLSQYDYVVDEDSEVDDYTDLEMKAFSSMPQRRRGLHVVPEQYASLGGPSAICSNCNARMWKEERVNKKVSKGTPIFSLCCMKGAVKLPKVPCTPRYLMDLYNDKRKGPVFQRMIRLYNSMFAFTSAGGNIDHSINSGRSPYVYRLNGQNHHVFGSLIPDDNETPKFCQLYIYDTVNEVENRVRWVNVPDRESVDNEVVQGLITMLDETNELVGKFRQQRDLYESGEIVDLEITLKVCRSQSGRENHMTESDEVAGIMIGDTEDTCGERDIIVRDTTIGLVRVSYVHPKLMALQYPLLFPTGEDGFHPMIKFQNTPGSSNKVRDHISMKDYYSYSFQVRENDGLTPRLGGRLFQQYLVDAFSSIEQTRLWWFRTHQTVLRNELYSHICDSVRRGDSDASNVGKGVILPAGFVGSKRYMQQNFQDALAVCRYVGHPDIFLTMTCNPFWDEIQKMMEFVPGCIAPNCPDIISRVFKLKLDQLMADIKNKAYFGQCIGVMYVVEFQKRGLPHVHMLIWLDKASKKNLKQNVDKFVSAEIPDPLLDPVGHAAVKEFMIHGPCGLQNVKSPCMKELQCIRHFPKKYCPRTTFDESGFPLYMRRRQNITVNVRKTDLDNQWVVPYNRNLLVKYQCHMNVEICCHARSLKYLFKYCLKGHDCATVHVNQKKKQRKNDNDEESIDEINAYFDGRYLCGAEAAYRIFGFPIHHRSISVERLPFHLPGEKNVTFRATESLGKVAAREKYRLSKLEAYFKLNSEDMNAHNYTYDEIPTHFVWNDTERLWTPRKRGLHIGRMCYAHHSTGEPWFLRLLLTKVRGATSFECLRTVKGVVYKSFREACKEYGLLDDDKEWHEVLTQCADCGLPPQIRQLFVHIIVNCKVTDLKNLWDSHWKNMVDDILLRRRGRISNANLTLNDKQLQFYALAEIDDLLRSIGKTLKHFDQLPQPPSSYLNNGSNNLIIEETSYDIVEMENEFVKLFADFTTEQREVYNAVLNSVETATGGLFFVYGSGGCGKTYLWRTIICKLRSQGKIVLPVASSGIAATLMPGGRTAHSRFKIPIVLDDFSTCNIAHDSDIAQLIRQTKLIIWDEAPMQHRYAFECLDRSLKDIMRSVDVARFSMPFGGITVVLGGDFRQILPVITYGERGEIVAACITRSRLWSICHVFLLTQNMRLNQGQSAIEIEALKAFAQWVLDIGNGVVPPPTTSKLKNKENEIEIPSDFCDLNTENSVDNMIASTYPNFEQNGQNRSYLSERAILTPTNQTVGHLNSLIVDKLSGESVSYFSVDSAEDFGGTDQDLNNAFPIEYLNSMSIPGLPRHDLKLKVGAVVMLMRNLNQTLGLCNGTRMIVTKCLKLCVECEVICGSFVGSKHFIPRMELSPTDTKMPFKLVRKQMPLQICYAMTINKSQGQSLKKVGLYLPKSVFTHGQFYVAISRVTSPGGLSVFVDDETGASSNTTENVVYKEVFYNLLKP